jgi:hypothetical protein
MKRKKADKHAPSLLETQILEHLRDGGSLADAHLTEFCRKLPGRPNGATAMAALRRLVSRGLLIEEANTFVPADAGLPEERKKRRARMTVSLAEKYGGVLFEDDVWCFLGKDGADKFAEAMKLEGLEVKRWRDDMAEKAQIVYA